MVRQLLRLPKQNSKHHARYGHQGQDERYEHLLLPGDFDNEYDTGVPLSINN